jgi:hypothetical protein
MPDIERERRAWQLLQWVPYSLPAKFDEDLALQGHYTKLQRQRSDFALDQWDATHQTPTSPELAAFLELEAKGVYNQSNFYLPSKAKDGYYSNRLKQFNEQATRLKRPSGSTTANRRTRRRRGLT